MESESATFQTMPSSTNASSTSLDGLSANSSQLHQAQEQIPTDISLFASTSNSIMEELYWHVLQDRECLPDELTVGDVVATLAQQGILFWRDERFQGSQDVALHLSDQTRTKFTNKVSLAAQKAASEAALTNIGLFIQFLAPCARLFLKAFSEEFVIPDWSSFVVDMEYHFNDTAPNKNGQNAAYIPILRDADPEKWGLSICTIDGQRVSFGDAQTNFSLQSVSKPVTYAMGLTQESEEFVDQWIDVEPAGRPFNTQDLQPGTNRPFNSSVNSGAIMACAIYASAFPDLSWKDIVDEVRSTWHKLSGEDIPVGFSEATFKSEKETAFNNFAIAYNLKGRRGLPRDIDLHKMLDVYLGCCSIELSVEALAVAASTLANGGICPITNKEIFPAHVTRTVLSEMMTCGMYDQAGRFAVEVGIPSKSGVSGALMVIVPNLFGFATFSPRLNANGNSVRGIEFCKKLVNSYRVHLFEPLRSGNAGAKIDPRRGGRKAERKANARMAWAVQVGDRYALRLRDVFLFALCQTAVSSQEGMSDRMDKLIKSKYREVYNQPVDEQHYADILGAVKERPGELKYLKELTHDVYILDTHRTLIVNSMIDVLLIDGHIDEFEKNVAVRIATLLGIDRGVALMELHRFCDRHQSQRQIHKDLEPCQLMDAMEAELPRSIRFGRRHISRGSHIRLPHGGNGQDEEDAEQLLKENEALRREVAKLRKKVSGLSSALHRR